MYNTTHRIQIYAVVVAVVIFCLSSLSFLILTSSHSDCHTQKIVDELDEIKKKHTRSLSMRKAAI